MVRRGCFRLRHGRGREGIGVVGVVGGRWGGEGKDDEGGGGGGRRGSHAPAQEKPSCGEEGGCARNGRDEGSCTGRRGGGAEVAAAPWWEL